MIVRIVRMEFDPAKVEAFLEVFEQTKAQIRHFPGVRHLELHRDASLANVFYTYSHWESEDALETYRVSPLFESVWARTKVHFIAKPQAYSLLLQQLVD